MFTLYFTRTCVYEIIYTLWSLTIAPLIDFSIPPPHPKSPQMSNDSIAILLNSCKILLNLTYFHTFVLFQSLLFQPDYSYMPFHVTFFIKKKI